MKCVCCKKNVRTTRDERDAFNACGYYTPYWWIRDQGIDPGKVARRGVDPENDVDFLCFDCAHDIDCEPSNSGESILTPVSESKKLREDSLDDFDTDGKIAAQNQAAMKDVNLQAAIGSIKESYGDFFDLEVGKLLASYGLTEVSKKYMKPGEYKAYITNNSFGGSVRVGSNFYIVFEIGDQYEGALTEHKDLPYKELKLALKEFSEDLKTEVNEIIEEAQSKGYSVEKLSGYGDVFVRSPGDWSRESVCIKISCKITQEEVDSLMENVKTKSKKISEADITRSFEFHGNGHTDYEGMGFDAYYAGVSYFDCPIKHPEWAYYKWKEGWKKAEKQDMLHESVEDYIHTRLKIDAKYVPAVYYACYTLTAEGYEEEHFNDFDLFEDAISACKQKTNETHLATHVCVIIEDEQDEEVLEFKRSYRLSNYEVVAEFSPDAGEALTEDVEDDEDDLNEQDYDNEEFWEEINDYEDYASAIEECLWDYSESDYSNRAKHIVVNWHEDDEEFVIGYLSQEGDKQEIYDDIEQMAFVNVLKENEDVKVFLEVGSRDGSENITGYIVGEDEEWRTDPLIAIEEAFPNLRGESKDDILGLYDEWEDFDFDDFEEAVSFIKDQDLLENVDSLDEDTKQDLVDCGYYTAEELGLEEDEDDSDN